MIGTDQSMNDNLGSRSSGRALKDNARVNYKSLHQGDYCLGDMSGNDDTEKEETVAVTKETVAVMKEQGAQITPEGASGGPGDFPHSMPRFGNCYGSDDDLETLNMEREMRELKAEDIRLKRATQKDSLQQQLEAQRQKVQNLRGKNCESVSEKADSGKKTEKKQSSTRTRLPASREVYTEREIDKDSFEFDETTSTLANFFTHWVAYTHSFHLIGYSNSNCLLKMSK